MKVIFIVIAIFVTFGILNHVSEAKTDAEVAACVEKGKQWYKDNAPGYDRLVEERCARAPKTAF